MSIDRRTFLKYVSVGAVALGLGMCGPTSKSTTAKHPESPITLDEQILREFHVADLAYTFADEIHGKQKSIVGHQNYPTSSSSGNIEQARRGIQELESKLKLQVAPYIGSSYTDYQAAVTSLFDHLVTEARKAETHYTQIGNQKVAAEMRDVAIYALYRKALFINEFVENSGAQAIEAYNVALDAFTKANTAQANIRPLDGHTFTPLYKGKVHYQLGALHVRVEGKDSDYQMVRHFALAMNSNDRLAAAKADHQMRDITKANHPYARVSFGTFLETAEGKAVKQATIAAIKGMHFYTEK